MNTTPDPIHGVFGDVVPFAEIVGTASAAQAEWHLTAARAVRPIIERVWPNELARTSLQAASRRAINEPGAFNQLSGHLFEQLDVHRHTLRHLREPVSSRSVLVLCDHPNARGYDAFRFVGGRFAGGVQHKMRAGTVRQSVASLESRSPGSAKYATFRVPSDIAWRTERLAGDRTRIQASEISRSDVHRHLKTGADQLTRYGPGATSRVLQTAKASGKSAAAAVAIGSLLDYRKWRRKELTGSHFLARRGVDAAEGATATALTSGAVAATTSIATTIAAAGGTGAVTATAVLTAPAWAMPLAAGVVVGVGVRAVAKRVRRRVDARFTTSATVDSVLLHDLDWHRPRPWVPAAAAMLWTPSLSLWTPRMRLGLWMP
ncbi:MAG: hypothetical protein ACOYXM_16720 [Actinomycetota bacterium]